MSVIVPQDGDWKDRALKWEREALKWTDEATRLKCEVEDWRNKFESLLEASLLQINRMADEGGSLSTQVTPVYGSASGNPSMPNNEESIKGKAKQKKNPFFPLFQIKDTTKKVPKSNKDSVEKSKSAPLLTPGGYQQATDQQVDFDPLSPSTSYQHLPRLQVNPLANRHRTMMLTGPEPERPDATYLDVVSGESISTYPFIPGNPTRDGDPICDRFSVQLFENRLIACVADGCNWGEKPRAAAHRATAAFVDYVNANHDAIVDVKKAGVVLLSAFESAHNSIMEGKEAFWEAGTTTLLGGVLLEINKGTDKFTPQWEFVCASIGDCKAFCYSNGEITDITHGNRQNTYDPRDCGGRLGPHLEEGKPDLRNLNLFCASCEEGDIIFIVTDGVHDNLDPQHLGKLPKDMPKEYNLQQTDKWDDVDTNKATAAKNAYTTQLLLNILGETAQPKEITNRLISHCVNVTKKSREYMESNNGKRLPEDYIEFPGKMDHTTCLCFRVGRFSLPAGPSPSSSPGSSPTNGTPNGNTPPQRDNWTKISPSPSVLH